MTIALGFVHGQGVVLAADTEVTTYGRKSHRAKLGYFEYPDGRFAFAMAGNAAYADSTLTKMKMALQQSSAPVDVPSRVEECIDSEYKRVVYPDTQGVSDGSAHFWFLFAFRPHAGKYELWATNANAVHRVDNFSALAWARR